VTGRLRARRAASRWEVGGDFERAPALVGPFDGWPADHRLFSIATHAIIVLWRSVPGMASRTLHVPDYFCPEVVDAWHRSGIAMAEFRDDPTRTEPDWTTLRPEPDDAVLAVDYFGVRDGTAWSSYQATHPRGLLIEDHSHDPHSTWASSSTADYAFASLRKIMPISDGAILWSPSGRPLPSSPTGPSAAGSALKHAAMDLKADYLAGADVDRSTYRDLQLRGEADLLAGPICAIGDWNVSILRNGIPRRWRQRRERNVRLLIESVGSTSRIRFLFESWPAGHCPFNAILVFASKHDRDECQAFLIDNRVFSPVHWRQPATAGPRVKDLADRILTIPLDHRYDAGDVRRVASILRSFEASHPAAVAAEQVGAGTQSSGGGAR
jgi:hypothetical protein